MRPRDRRELIGVAPFWSHRVRHVTKWLRCAGIAFCDLLKFEQEFLIVLGEITDHTSVAQQLTDIPSSSDFDQSVLNLDTEPQHQQKMLLIQNSLLFLIDHKRNIIEWVHFRRIIEAIADREQSSRAVRLPERMAYILRLDKALVGPALVIPWGRR